MNLASLIAKGTLRGFATATPATPATDDGAGGRTVATVATVAVAIAPDSKPVNDPAQDPDRWAWPHSAAMTGAEIEVLTARLARFTGRGLTLEGVERLADGLVTRDREGDDRRLCLECAHLTGHAAGAMGCTNRQRAGVTIRARGAQLPGDLVQTLQRCDGFKVVTT